jgi:excisionase family DNA binding protein
VSRRRVVDAQEPPPASCPHCGIDLLPVSEAARRLDVTPKTVARWTRQHDFPVIRLVGVGRLFCFWSDVEEWSRRHQAVRRNP